jgi:hypothetical protein
MPMGCHQEKNYERLEILGDAFLKYAASLYVYSANPNWHEGMAQRMGIDAPWHTFNSDVYIPAPQDIVHAPPQGV